MLGMKISAFRSTPTSSPVASPWSLVIRVHHRGRCTKGRLITSRAPVVAGSVPRDVPLGAPGPKMTRTGRIGPNMRRRAAVMVTTRTTRTSISRKSKVLKPVPGGKKNVSELNQKVVRTVVLVFRPMQSKLKKLVYKFRCRRLRRPQLRLILLQNMQVQEFRRRSEGWNTVEKVVIFDGQRKNGILCKQIATRDCREWELVRCHHDCMTRWGIRQCIDLQRGLPPALHSVPGHHPSVTSMSSSQMVQWFDHLQKYNHLTSDRGSQVVIQSPL